MATFIEQWKTAKSTFEATVKDKKPSPKLLGKVRTGSGMDTALKDLDKAKKKEEAVKAIATFEKAATDYCKVLLKEIADPTSVKVVDKATYTTALEKLKKHLERIITEAKKLAASLDGQEKTSAVNTKLLQAAQQHLLMQRKAIDAFTKLGQEMANHESQIKLYHEGAKKRLADYKNPKLAEQCSVNSATIGRFLDESDKLRKGTAKKQMEEKIKKHEAAEKQLAEVDAVKAKLKEVPAATIAEAKKNVATVIQLKQTIDAKYKSLEALVGQIRAISEEARPVDQEALHSAEEHLKLRSRMVVEVTKWSKETPAQLKNVQEFLTTAERCSAQAKQAASQGKKSVLEQIENVCVMTLAAAKKQVKASEDLIAERTKNGSDLMAARGDVKNDWDKLPPSIGDGIRKQAGAAFGKLDVVQRAWQAPIAKMGPIVTQIESILDQIEALGGKVKPASHYLAWLTPAASESAQDVLTANTRLDKVVGYSNTFFPKHEGKTLGPKDKELVQKQYDFFQAACEKMNETIANHKLIASRLDGIPSQEVAVTTIIDKIRKDMASVSSTNSTYQAEAKKADVRFKKLLAG